MKKYGILAFGGGAISSLYQLEKSALYDKIAIDTDTKHLSYSDSDIKIFIGEIENGLGCGGLVTSGARALDKNIMAIQNVLKNYEQVFIIACLGGGCSTGCITELAQYLKENYLMILTIPFSFEGKHRMNRSIEALEELERLNINKLTIKDDYLLQSLNQKITLNGAFKIIDKKIAEEIKRIIN